MQNNFDRRTIVIGLASLAISNNFALAADSHSIEMLNKHPEDKKRRMVFHPLIQVIEPGDTIKFLASSKGHNSISIEGMIPDGATAWKGKINEEIEVTLDKPGVYGYFCQPHATLGMVGLIIVKGEGMTGNLESAKAVKHKGRARKVWKEIWETVDSEGLLTS